MREEVKLFVEGFEKARSIGVDPFGFASDPEASMKLAQVVRARFLREKNLRALREWADLLGEINRVHSGDLGVIHWMSEQLVALDQAVKLAVRELEFPDLRPAMRSAAESLQSISRIWLPEDE